ncbi:MAG: CheR family methyltransferase [Candidatus Electronema sp. V4]|uniref:CheR family methyltransferase n=1 Tax=Candidatus Electronema sp. V4 TaxID=3454756 RepID=UPI0040556CB3
MDSFPGLPPEIHVVGIGASAGGLEALTSFFSATPPDSGMVFIVVQHLSPNCRSMMGELLANHTAMPVCAAENGMLAEPNCVYLQPPQTCLNLFNGRLLLDVFNGQQGLHLPIDYFFRSLAEDRKDKAVAVVLSGTGSDGSRGLPSIREAGGLILVQEVADAGFDGMPGSAAATGLADYICPAAEMPAKIAEYIRHPFVRRKIEQVALDEEASLTRIIALLRTQQGIDFTRYKPFTVIRRITRRMAIARCASLHDYAEFLLPRPGEVSQLCRDLLIGVTKFFRDRREFDFFREKIIPQILEQAEGQGEIRVWDAGCSTGEEAYTIAMLLHDHLCRRHAERTIKIKVFATDLDQHAVEKAARGFYPDGIAADMPPELLERYFSRVENGYVVRRHIRELVIFARQNLLSDPPFTRLDLAVCRNLLIYLLPPQQKEVLSIFHFALREGGFLFLGSNETVMDAAESFVAVDRQIKIYRHTGKGNLPLARRLRLAVKTAPAGKIQPQPGADSSRRHLDMARRLELREAYYQQIISRLTAACLVVNGGGEIIETFGRTDLLLQPQPGRMNLSISKMLAPELLLPVTSALRACRQEEGGEVLYDGIRVSGGGKNCRFLLRAMLLPGDEDRILIALERMPISSFAEASAGLSQAAGAKAADEEIRRHVLDLEREIQFTRESLQAANEQLQTSNEELLASNEELLASNEELQSANEELNSVNEELSTVNTEYQSKILELTELYNDIDNLFCSTDIGFIFVDRQLRIRKYTPPVCRAINLMEQDVGRKISDMSAPLLGDVETEFGRMLSTRQKREKVVRHGEGCWYLVQFIPYLDETNEVSGMVISLVDVSGQKKAEEALRQSSEILEQILAASPAPTMMVTQEGRICFANEIAAGLFGAAAKALEGQPLCSGQFRFTDLDGADFADSREFLRAAIEQAENKEPMVIRLKGQDGRQEYFLTVNASTLNVKESRLQGVVLTFTEVARHQA